MCIKASIQTQSGDVIVRQCANYNPPLWKDDFIQSLHNEFRGETYRRRFSQLKEQVQTLLKEESDSLEQLELIDALQKLGISYHFESEIKNILQRISNKSLKEDRKKNSLYATSLEFRLLRQHQFDIYEGVFNAFKDEMGNLKTCSYEDINEMLSLYEASFLSTKGETILEEAKCFAVKYLNEFIKSSKDELKVEMVEHALKLPLHWRIERLEARWSIDIYERIGTLNPILLEIAKLDFNMVQSIYQEDLKYASSWWRDTELGEKMSFARDQLMENFYWTVGIGFEPELSYFRRMGTKIVTLITMIDDVYDVYGTLDELKLFTTAIQRWDIGAMDQLPEYLKQCFFTLYNSINEIAYEALINHGVDVMQYLKKVWGDLCKSYLIESNWHHSGYKPTLEEYMNNAWISVAGPLMLVHSYIFVSAQISKHELERLTKYEDTIRWSSTIMRLANDLLTPLDEQNIGDVPKSIQCYMNETGTSEKNARVYIKHMVDELWKKLNEYDDEKLVSSQPFVKMPKNLARISQCMYQYGEGDTLDHNKTKESVVSLLVTPIIIHSYN
ncbi:terpene synthase 10-like [Cucumis melo var. makuwa]|uniref:Terpene synthase 10-like n=1 Tax=Cucumis melo var. makuwa TaxID=1194695 RepID=A0A5D3BVK8_CUCMM|nr:terpene synthase 10-like [Cucumis melo var. makuwa]TYK02119.1 terpene synthase 10-like [Cucumis melo var. makuwa]